MPRGILPLRSSAPASATRPSVSSLNSAEMMVYGGSRHAEPWVICWRRGSGRDERVRRSRLLCSLALILPIVVPGAALAAQSADPSSSLCSTSSAIDVLLTEGRRLADIDQNLTARPCFEKAIRLSIDAGDRSAELKARVGLAQAIYHAGDYKAASAESERASTLAEALGDRLEAAHAADVRGFVATSTGDDVAARQYFEKSLAAYTALGLDSERASALINLSFTIPDSDPEEARVLDEALAISRRIGAPETEGRALHNRSDLAFHAGRFDEAIADLTLAIAKFKEAEKPARMADAYVSLGRMYRVHGQPERALEYYDRAAEIQERTGDLRGLVQSFNAKAIALGILDRYKESRDAYERALELARKTGSERLINFQQGNLTAAYESTGDRAGAIRLLEDVLTRETDPYLLAYRHGNLGTMYSAQGQYDVALQHADRSIEYGLKSSNRDYLVDLYFQRASINRLAGRIDPALEDAREAVRLVEEIRSSLVPVDFMKRGFSDLHQSLYGLTLGLMIQRGQPEQALIISEQARARAFLDLLASRNLVETSSKPSPLPTGFPPSAPPQSDSSVARPAPAAPSLDLRGLEGGPSSSRHGDLTLSSYASTKTASSEEIAATATRLKTTILAYWVTDKEVFAWVIQPGHAVESARIEVARTTLERMVEAAVPKADAYDAAAYRRLYTLLIAPVA